MKKIILGILLIFLLSGVGYGEQAISRDEKIEHQISDIRAELTKEMDESFSGLSEEWNLKIDDHFNSSISLVNTLLVYVGIAVAIITIIITLVGGLIVRNARKELNKAKEDCDEAKEEYLKSKKSLDDAIKNMSGDLERYKNSFEDIIGKNWNPEKPLVLTSQQEERIDKILGKPTVPILIRLQAMALKAQNNSKWEVAFFLWKMVVALNPKGSQAYFYQGYYYQLKAEEIITEYKDKKLKEKYLTKALDKYNEAIVHNPDDASSFLNSGIVLAKLNHPEKALEKFEKAIYIAPEYGEAWGGCGSTLGSLSRFNEALIKIKKAKNLGVENEVIYFNWGSIMKAQGNLKEAYRKYKKALQYKPDYGLAYNGLGDILRTWGKLEEAYQEYEKAITCNPNHSGFLNNSGTILGELNRPEEALEKFEKATYIDPYYADAYYNWGTSLLAIASKTQDLEKKKELETRANEKFAKARELNSVSEESLTEEDQDKGQ